MAALGPANDDFLGALYRQLARTAYQGGEIDKDDLGFIPREGVDILTASVLRRMRPRATSRYVREFRATLPEFSCCCSSLSRVALMRKTFR